LNPGLIASVDLTANIHQSPGAVVLIIAGSADEVRGRASPGTFVAALIGPGTMPAPNVAAELVHIHQLALRIGYEFGQHTGYEPLAVQPEVFQAMLDQPEGVVLIVYREVRLIA
jgi:hypothetical protein